MDTAKRIEDATLIIDDSAGTTVTDLRTKVRQRKSQLVIVDYLQLMSSAIKRRDDNRQQEVSDMSRGLKLMARELNVAVIALSQLNRSLEGRIDRRPRLSDLRESGSLEQDADVVAFLYRDEVYHDKPGNAGRAELTIAKNRNGPCGKVDLTWNASYTRFTD
jgi:replicative DNA helicase